MLENWLAIAQWTVTTASWGTVVVILWRGGHRSRGAAAWIIGLIGLPWLTLPLYWTSGQVRYSAYRRSQMQTRDHLQSTIEQLREAQPEPVGSSDRRVGERRALTRMAALGTHRGPDPKLITGGQERLDALIECVEEATRYVLLQTYQLKDDPVGQRVQTALIEAAQRGCKTYLLYDELGSSGLTSSYIDELEDGGVQVQGFSKRRRFLPQLRSNFRNHRKLAVIDGTIAFMGGMNLAQDYIDGADNFEHWRDTQIQVGGRHIAPLQLYFAEDWQFATDQSDSSLLDLLHWDLDEPSQPASQVATVCGFGPQDIEHSGDVVITFLIEAATQRLVVATPYFIPDDRIVASLLSAAARGVSVEVLVPRSSDHWIFSRLHRRYAAELEPSGIRVSFYEKGFMHQKVIMVDSLYAAVGSANLDNRSLRLNFELLTVFGPGRLMDELDEQLSEDFSIATLVTGDEQDQQQWYKRLGDKALQLFAPIL